VARYPYPAIDNLPEHLAKEIRARVAPDRGNVWRMLMWAQEAAGPFVDFSEAVRHHSSLEPRLRELIILRVGHLCEADYEVHHHERIGREVGLSEHLIAATRDGPKASGFDATQSFVIELVDEMVKSRKPSDASFKKAIDTLGVRTLIDILLLVGFYQMACLFLRTFEIDIEKPAAKG
jgi:alkylhydroperoxidase family enzyme